MSNDKVAVIIPSRNEPYLQKTIDETLRAADGPIEVIAILDGTWPEQPIPDHPDVTLIHHTAPVGQRAAVNEGVRMTNAKYILKVDAHNLMDDGFDTKLKADCEYDWTVLPRMYNLDIETFKEKRHKCTDFMYIGPPDNPDHERSNKMRSDYWRSYGKRPEAQGDIVDVMTGQGACWFMHRDRYIEIGLLDEAAGVWGQVGVEVALKTWLSGGRHVVNKKTWFSHWFRKQWPYAMTYAQQEHARQYFLDFWLNNKYNSVRPLSWVIEKFWPVPHWTEPMLEFIKKPVYPLPDKNKDDLTLVYYTANVASDRMMVAVCERLSQVGKPIVSVSQKPMRFGQNVCIGKIGRSLTNIYRQVLEGAKAAETEYVALVEDDCLYHSSHFDYRPAADTFAYNKNRWNLHVGEEIYSYRDTPVLSQCIAPRKLLIEHLEEKLALPEIPDRLNGEPGVFDKKLGITERKTEMFSTKQPNVVLCHRKNYLGRKLKTDITADSIDYWGSAKKVIQDYVLDVGAEETPNAPHKIPAPAQKGPVKGLRDFPVKELYDNMLCLAEPRKGKRDSMVKVIPALTEFVEMLKKDDNPSDEQIKQTQYYENALTKLNPLDKNPYTEKGKKHTVKKVKDTIKLFRDIRDHGLKAPITCYAARGRLAIIRGCRRLIIAHGLGIEKIQIRLFRKFKYVQLWDTEVDQWQSYSGNPKRTSIHELAMRQFMELGGEATDKYWVHGYTQIYDRFFHPYRRTKKSILELGLKYGASMKLWREAFPKARLVGLDKNYTTWKKYTPTDKKTKVIIGAQDDENTLAEVAKEGPFDIIIDDCSHVPEHQMASFNYLWKHVSSHGLYVIEDCWHSYWKDNKDSPNLHHHFAGWVDKLYRNYSVLEIYQRANLIIIKKGL